jgi:phosphohistidine phosphatase
MVLYLVQHAQAKSKDEDPERPITDQGRREMESVMLLMMRYGAITASRVMHSGKLRAQETADIIASKIEADTEEADGLGPNDDPSIWAQQAASSSRDLVLVGHMPHLSRLASLLLCGNPDQAVVEFTNGGVVCVARDDERWHLRWAVTPSLVQE